MVDRVSDRRKPAVFAALGFILVAAGCQSGNPLGALDFGGGGRQDTTEERITAEELLAYCPSLTIRSRDTVHDSYQRGGEGDASKLVYRTSITDATRACSYGGGMLGMTVAVAGRVVPGPSGTVGAVRAPIRVTVYQGTEAVYDQVHDYQVAVADTAGATQFLFTDASISMPNPTSRNIQVQVGFDSQAPAGRR